jgi:carboxypeptidase Q
MNKISRLKLFLFLSAPVHFVYAQKEKVDTAAFRKIRNAELNSSQIPMIAHYLTDVAGSRLTNSPGFFRAGKWAVEAMKNWGLKNASLEPWGEFGKGWEAEEFSISMRSPYYGYIIGYPLPWSANTNGEIHAPVKQILEIELLDSAYLAQHKDEFKGKIVLVTGSSTQHDSDFKPFSTRYTDSELARMPDLYVYNHQQIGFFIRFSKMLIAGELQLKSYGALALVSTKSTGRDGTVVVQNMDGYKIDSPVILPEAEISSEDGFRIRRLMETGQTVELALNIKAKFFTEDTKGYNVIAEIPGTDPVLKNEMVMLGAHLDSWSAATGATDNAAGCAIMMEAVRLLDSLNLKPKRTIRIALWSGEEQGVYGSYNYVKNHFGNGETGIFKPEQKKISIYFNLDAGTGKIRGVYSDGDSAIKPIFEQWLMPFHDLGATTVTLSSTGSTDHVPFEWAGIPGIDFMQDPLDYESKTHHTNMDTYDYLQIDDMKQAAIIIASFVYQAATRADLMPRKNFTKTIFPFEGL